MEEKSTRVVLYAKLRDEIDKMDTFSLDSDKKSKEYGIDTSSRDTIPIVHEDAMSPDELKDRRIKKNTLSISIDELIKQNDDYTVTLEKKELDQKYKDVKKKEKGSFWKWLLSHKLLLVAIIVVFLVLVAGCVYLALYLGRII